MANAMDHAQRLELAQKRAEAKIGFYIHAAIFAAVNSLLIAINLSTDPEPLWFVWPLIGWGAGLLGHGLLVYNPPRGSDFKQRLIEKELARLEVDGKREGALKEDTPAQNT